MPYPQIHRLVVAGGDRVGKTAIIEQLIFGNHVIGQVGIQIPTGYKYQQVIIGIEVSGVYRY